MGNLDDVLRFVGFLVGFLVGKYDVGKAEG